MTKPESVDVERGIGFYKLASVLQQQRAEKAEAECGRLQNIGEHRERAVQNYKAEVARIGPLLEKAWIVAEKQRLENNRLRNYFEEILNMQRPRIDDVWIIATAALNQSDSEDSGFLERGSGNTGSGKGHCAQRRASESSADPAPDPDYKERYYDLIMCVATKHPDESRHDTAKRYIVNAETPKDNQARAKAPDPDRKDG